jgi:hypothetical protein
MPQAYSRIALAEIRRCKSLAFDDLPLQSVRIHPTALRDLHLEESDDEIETPCEDLPMLPS